MTEFCYICGVEWHAISQFNSIEAAMNSIDICGICKQWTCPNCSIFRDDEFEDEVDGRIICLKCCS